MRKYVYGLLMAAALLVGLTGFAAASSNQPYYQGKVLDISKGAENPNQTVLRVQIQNGPDKGKTVSAGTSGLYSASDIALPKYSVGDIVVLAPSQVSDQSLYAVVDHYRLKDAGIILAVVVALAIFLARWRGLGSLVGLGISIIVITQFVMPQILHGQNPYVVSLIGSFVVATLGIYFAHGFSRRTSLALISTYLTLVIAAVTSVIAVRMTHLNGISGEDISYLHQQLPNLNLQGLLLGGIMIGVLGVLDDITVGQAAAVDELRKANPSLTWRELYQRGLSVGREHIAAMINTLVLAYAGSAFIFIFYISAVLNLPIWLSLNSELVMEEIVRSLVGSLALLLAVPIATLISAYFLVHGPSHVVAAIRRRSRRATVRQ